SRETFGRTNRRNLINVKDSSAPKLDNRISLDDWLYEGEVDRIAREHERENLKLGNNGQHRYCYCRELIVNGTRVPCPPFHSCEYVAARSALVEKASRIATRQVGDPMFNVEIGNQWTRAFNDAMTKLAKPLFNGQSVNGERKRQTALECELSAGSINGHREGKSESVAYMAAW